jgi:hypothetical protein
MPDIMRRRDWSALSARDRCFLKWLFPWGLSHPVLLGQQNEMIHRLEKLTLCLSSVGSRNMPACSGQYSLTTVFGPSAGGSFSDNVRSMLYVLRSCGRLPDIATSIRPAGRVLKSIFLTAMNKHYHSLKSYFATSGAGDLQTTRDYRHSRF